jgi:thioredoxin 1
MIRLVVFILIVVLLWSVTWAGHTFVEMRRRQALAAAPLDTTALGRSDEADSIFATTSGTAQVRILAFQSDDCRQCQTLQAPALKRVQKACGDSVLVLEIDAPGAPELTQHYRVLTLPTTVVLDANGNARAVNYGFAPAQRLLEQVHALLPQ